MAGKKQKSKRRKQASPNPQSSSLSDGGKERSSRWWVGLLVLSVGAAVAVGGALWTRAGSRGGAPEVEAAQRADAAEQAINEVYYVNNRQCAMSDSPIAEKDMGRFESRVVYDGPIERFQGKTLVFNQCCSMCIESFPKKWAAERDEIMAKFGLTTIN